MDLNVKHKKELSEEDQKAIDDGRAVIIEPVRNPISNRMFTIVAAVLVFLAITPWVAPSVVTAGSMSLAWAVSLIYLVWAKGLGAWGASIGTNAKVTNAISKTVNRALLQALENKGKAGKGTNGDETCLSKDDKGSETVH